MGAIIEMIRILAEIELFESGRNNPIISGYRPAFRGLNDSTLISGKIILIHKEYFFPGERGIVEINFLDGSVSGDYLAEGRRFTFGEGSPTAIGDGVITKILK